MRQQIKISSANICRIEKYINQRNLFASAFGRFAAESGLMGPRYCLLINDVKATGKFRHYLEVMP
ncbi:MAG: hypothetical protein HKL96_13655 [Phycisphaerales bacterium]|nr:hypothetical protein [Phycisphaerales bacterium]